MKEADWVMINTEELLMKEKAVVKQWKDCWSDRVGIKD